MDVSAGSIGAVTDIDTLTASASNPKKINYLYLSELSFLLLLPTGILLFAPSRERLRSWRTPTLRAVLLFLLLFQTQQQQQKQHQRSSHTPGVAGLAPLQSTNA
jgi:hypothetical protein